MATVAAVLILLYNLGQTTVEKTRAVNAADAAAYSGGIWVARQLNFMAYTNRAMIANHVAVGHFISYMSWIRYVEDSSDKLRSVTQFIPYVNVATQILATWAQYVRQGTEYFAKIFVPATDAFNRSMYVAQAAAKASTLGTVGGSSLTPLHLLMDATAKKYDPTLRVNDPNDLAMLNGAVSGTQIASELLAIYRFTDSYDASSDGGRIKSLVEGSYGASRAWISGDRGWSKCLFITCAKLPGNLRVGKSGSTTHTISGSELGWSANDQLGIWRTKKKRWWSSYKWRGGAVANGSAAADEFDNRYAGIDGYYALEDRRDRDQALYLSAYVSVAMDAVKTKDLLGYKPAIERISALSRAKIFYRKPQGFGSGTQAFSNVFNPFWRARLVEYKPFYIF